MSKLPQPKPVALPHAADAGKLAFTLDEVFTKEECEAMIAETDRRGYDEAKINVGNGREVVMKDIRNNDRCLIDDTALAGRIFARVKHTLPKRFKNHTLVSLNERLRFLRYTPGQKFEPHMDGAYARDNGEMSQLTLQLYLNEGCEGGTTRFLHWEDETRHVDVVPRTGMVIVFQHDILHSGAEVTSGVKYVMRTDIMYK